MAHSLARYSKNFLDALRRFRSKPFKTQKGLALRTVLNGLGNLSRDEELEVEAAIAAWESSRRVRLFLSVGTRGSDRWTIKGPGTRKIGGVPGAYNIQGTWFDHGYRRTIPGKLAQWISEPYQLGPEAILELADLISKGWVVRITGRDALHYPGDTVSVVMERESGESDRLFDQWRSALRREVMRSRVLIKEAGIDTFDFGPVWFGLEV